MAEAYSVVFRHHVLFNHHHLLMGYGCFCLLTLCIMLLWTLVYKSVLVLSIIPILWGYNPRNKVDGSHGNSFKFLKNDQTFPQWQCHFISPLSVTKVPVSPCLPQYLLFSIVLIIVILMSVKWYLICFWFAFPWWLMILSIFSCTYWPFISMSSLEKCLFRPFAHFWIGLFLFVVEV